MTSIQNIAKWVRSTRASEVKFGSLPRTSSHALRCAAREFNRTYGLDWNVFVHVHYDYFKEVAVVVGVTLAERELELTNISHKNDWKKKIPTTFDD